MSIQIFGETPVYVNQNTSVAATTTSFVPDFIFNTNTALGPSTIDGAVFSNASYVQNSEDPNSYNVDLVVNVEFVNTLLTLSLWNHVNVNDHLPANQYFTDTLGPVGSKLLETVAIKLFGHPKATAAITNDTDFATLSSQTLNSLSEQIKAAIETDKNLIFQAYVNAGKIANDDDVTTPQTMNFTNVHIAVPMYLQGNILDKDSGVISLGPLRNGYSGYDPVDGSRMVNGVYNIPLALSFMQMEV